MTHLQLVYRAAVRFAGVCSLVASGVPSMAQQAVPVSPPPVQQQQSAQPSLIGTVSLEDATVTGAVSTTNDRATLVWNGTVVAKDHVAYVELARGGAVRLCATSGLHLTAGAPAKAEATVAAGIATVLASAPPAPLMLSLDRGALEIRMNATASDLLMTPDMRIGFTESGALDLHVRVTRNGDTCVENRVAGLGGHPALHVASMFGDDTYNVLPGQHVLFERGSLREVVDNESSPCGCPEASAVHAVEAGDLSLKKAEKVSGTQAEAQHPFPAAVSQELASPPEVPQAAPGATHTQMATTLSYPGAETAAGAATEPVVPPGTPPATPAATRPATPPPPATKGGFFHAIGRFFKRVF